MTIQPLRSVRALVERFESTFSTFIDAFNGGHYVLWLGSGISRDRVPNVSEMLERVVEHLRTNADLDDAADSFLVALHKVLGLATLTPDELKKIDLSIAVAEWPLRERVISALVMNYAKVLDVGLGDNEPGDYLVWNGLDVAETYGSPALDPDVEHYCIAMLMLEGLVVSAVTANWDGLLEKALGALAGPNDSLVRVVVRPEDFRINGRRLDVIKFHGCAVLARQSEDTYRALLVARQSQISKWTEQPANRLMRKHLEVLYTDHLSLVVGLSAQDANLQTVFAGAIQDLSRPWPAEPPAVVLSEEKLEEYHRNLLEITYDPNYEGNSAAIAESALLGAYAKPTLQALVLSALTTKLMDLMDVIDHELKTVWGGDPATQLRAGLVALRGLVAADADLTGADYSETLALQRAFVARMVDVVSLCLGVFRNGFAPPDGSQRYYPLSDRPIAQAILNADFPARQYALLSAALSLVGTGVETGHWSIAAGSTSTPAGGAICLVGDDRYARVFFVKDAATAIQLDLAGLYEEQEADVLVVVADEEPRPQARTPRARFGRDGRTAAGRFNVATAIRESTSSDDLFEAFQLAGGF